MIHAGGISKFRLNECYGRSLDDGDKLNVVVLTLGRQNVWLDAVVAVLKSALYWGARPKGLVPISLNGVPPV